MVLCILSSFRSAAANDQNWTSNTFKWRINKTLQFWFTQEIRSNNMTSFDDIFAKYLEVTVRHAANSTFYWAVRYRHQWNEKKGVSIGEDRWVVEGGAKTTAFRRLTLDVRLRFDGKNFDHSAAEDYIWYRMRFRSTVHLQMGNFRISPFLATEPFGNTLPATKTFINQNRLYAGATFPMGNHFVLAVDYIRQDIRGREPDHILRTTFEWII